MKKKDFLGQLNEELNDAAPEMSERLKKQPIRTAAPGGEAKPARNANPKPRRRRPIVAAVACAAAAVICSAAVLPLLVRSPAPEAAACLYIDINPSLALTLDGENKVRKAVSCNADGDAIATDSDFVASLVGTDAADAAVKIAERATEGGYFSPVDEGTAECYNQMHVTLKSTEETEAELGEIRGALVEYFCGEGIYVYVEADAETDESARGERDALENRSASYAEWVGAQSAEALTQLTEETAYDYAAELLRDALYKYDLFAEIDALDESIRSDPDNLLGLNYWTVDRNLNDNIRSLAAEAERKLEILYLLYGTDGRTSALAYTTARLAYSASVALADVDALRDLAARGINDESFGGIENIGVRANYFYFVSNDILSELATEIWSGTTSAVENLLSDLGKLISDRAEALSERLSGLLSLPREPIGREDYLEFLRRIGKA